MQLTRLVLLVIVSARQACTGSTNAEKDGAWGPMW